MAKKKLKIDTKIIFIVAMLIVMFLAFFYLGNDFGFNAHSFTDFLGVLPYLFFFIVGLYIIVTMRGLYLLPAFGILGFGVAGILHEMHGLGMITAQMMTGLTIEEIMFWTVLISLVFGGILTAVTSKKHN